MTFNNVLFEYKPDTIVEKTARYISTAVKKMISPEEDNEEAAYDRADDLVRPGFLKPSYSLLTQAQIIVYRNH